MKFALDGVSLIVLAGAVIGIFLAAILFALKNFLFRSEPRGRVRIRLEIPS